MAADSTTYSIKYKIGERSTITLPKSVADLLQASEPNVHALIQDIYEEVDEQCPWLGRREKGDKVRMNMLIRALKYCEKDL